MKTLHIDTHVAAWLFAGATQRLGPALPTMASNRLKISPMVVLELGYLHQIGRLTVPANDIVADLRLRCDVTVATVSWTEAVSAALPLSFTRDPFDRLILATAMIAGVKLVTADKVMLQHAPSAVWKT